MSRPHLSVESLSLSLLLCSKIKSTGEEFKCNLLLLLLLLLSCFSRIWLCVTPETAAHQAPPSLGFSRQEHWSGLPFLSPMHESEKSKRNRSVVSDSSDPMDCSPPGSSIHGIFQARVLEWGAIAFSLTSHSQFFPYVNVTVPYVLFYNIIFHFIYLTSSFKISTERFCPF